MPAKRDDSLVFEQGAVFRKSWSFLGLDLTGAVGHMQARDASGTLQLDVTYPPVDGSGITIDVETSSTGEPVSTVTVVAQSDLTTLMTPGHVVFDIKLLNASDEDERIIEGSALVTPQVTL